MMPKPYDPMEYHMEMLAEDLARQHPDTQRIKDECLKQVQQGMEAAMRPHGRQNRTNADKEPLPGGAWLDNPTGAHPAARPKKG